MRNGRSEKRGTQRESCVQSETERERERFVGQYQNCKLKKSEITFKYEYLYTLYEKSLKVGITIGFDAESLQKMNLLSPLLLEYVYIVYNFVYNIYGCRRFARFLLALILFVMSRRCHDDENGYVGFEGVRSI